MTNPTDRNSSPSTKSSPSSDNSNPISTTISNRISHQGISLDQSKVSPPNSSPSSSTVESVSSNSSPIHHFQNSADTTPSPVKPNPNLNSQSETIKSKSTVISSGSPPPIDPSPPNSSPLPKSSAPLPLPLPPKLSSRKSAKKGIIFAGIAFVLLLIGIPTTVYLISRLSFFTSNQPVEKVTVLPVDKKPTPTQIAVAPQQAAFRPETFNYQCDDGTVDLNWSVNISSEDYDSTTGTYSISYQLTRPSDQADQIFEGTVGAYLCHSSETIPSGESRNCQQAVKGIEVPAGQTTTTVSFSAGEVTGENCTNCEPETAPVTGSCGSFQIDLTGLYMNSSSLGAGVKCAVNETGTLYAICSSAVNPADGISACSQIPAQCGGPASVVCQDGELTPTGPVTTGTKVTYTIDSADYTSGWEPGIRYSYGENLVYGDADTTFCSTATGTCTQSAKLPKLWFFTNLKKDFAGQTYWCRPEEGGTWTTLDAQGNLIDSVSPDGSVCQNTCVSSVAIETITTGPYCQSLQLADTQTTPAVILVDQTGQQVTGQPKIGQSVTAICQASDLPPNTTAQYQFTLIPTNRSPINLSQTQNCDPASASCDFVIASSGSFKLNCQVTSQTTTP